MTADDETYSKVVVDYYKGAFGPTIRIDVQTEAVPPEFRRTDLTRVHADPCRKACQPYQGI